jgi:anhydro-N-acetylmuramic acid kinase
MESTEVGLDVDAKEAIAFAVMAYETANQRPSNIPTATGAKRPVLLGKVTPNGGSRTPNPNPAAATNGNGRTSASSATATHKAKATRNNQLSRTPVAAKAKAAVR